MCEALATNAIWFNVKFTIDFILLHTASPFPYHIPYGVAPLVEYQFDYF